MAGRHGSNAGRVAARLASGWNLPPGMRPGDESPPEPAWYDAAAQQVYEEADPEKLDNAMREAIAEDADEELTADQVEELAAGDYYSPTTVDLDWDSATLRLKLKKPTSISGAPRNISVYIDNPFVE
jgi:hypothetical protein